MIFKNVWSCFFFVPFFEIFFKRIHLIMSQFLVYFSNFHHFFLQFGVWTIVGVAYQGKDIIVFRFIIEYNSLRDFPP
jgi:hypothetical protein